MKCKVKYSNTQKFVVNVEDETLDSLKHEIRKFVEEAYKQTVKEPLTLSLNGREPFVGTGDTSLRSLGVVPGDLLIVMAPSAVAAAASLSQETTDSTPVSQVPGCSRKMESASEKSAATEASRNTGPESAGAASCEARSCSALDAPRDVLLEAKDGQPTASLEKLFSDCEPCSASQAVNLVVHLTMLECGFIIAGENTLTPPKGWKEMVATFQYNNTSYPDFKCTLVLVTMGEVKQVLASFPGQESEISLRLVLKEYVREGTGSPVLATNLVRVSQLARSLRDRLLHPLQVAAHQALGVPAPWHLAGLPHEILLNIAILLDYRYVLALRASCRRLHSAMDDHKLWQSLYKRDFSNLYSNVDRHGIVDWKAKYKDAVLQRKEWKRQEEITLEAGMPLVYPSPFMPFRPPGSYLPRPKGPGPYPPQPHPQPNPFYDPDSPYFGGEMPPVPGAFPQVPDPLDPFGPMGPMLPGPGNSFMPPRPRNPRGPRFDFFF